MRKTYVPKKNDIQRIWYLADASDKILGKLAVRVATVLRGKHKPMYTPHLDTGDGVIVINASKIRVTGRKPEQKMYRRHSGYPGGFREVKYKTMVSNKPLTVIRLAVKKMLPSGPLANSMLRKLRVYADDKYPHKGLKTTTLEI
jgi:large subunit ribosomal protein L13